MDILKTGRNVFLTGAPGAGKTYVLNKYIAFLREQGVVVGVTASTGIAATHLGGMTIHAWSGLGIKDHLRDADIATIVARAQVRRRIRKAAVLVIDEVSMLAAHTIDLVDRICRAARESDAPFGGLQVVFCGDFFQLPPVRGRRPQEGEDVSYDDPFFAAEAAAWRAADVQVCYLDSQHRHEDEALLEVLQAMRDGTVTEDTVRTLRHRINAPISGSAVPTRLYTHNADVDRLNAQQLAQLTTPGRRYRMTLTGRERVAAALARTCLAPEELVLRIGAAVMFVKNNFDAGYANGTLGTVVDFTAAGLPVVETFDGTRVRVEAAGWVLEENDVEIAGVRQIPLRLAWAMTVHKSQGMTLDAAVIDLARAFVPGMGYVALSRVRSLRTLSLLGLGAMALTIDERVRELDGALRAQAEEAEAWVEAARAAGELAEAQTVWLARATARTKRPSHEVTGAMVAEGVPLATIVATRGMSTATILTHLEKLRAAGAPAPTYLLEDVPQEAVAAITAALRARADRKLAPVHRALKGAYTYEQIRLVRVCLDD